MNAKEIIENLPYLMPVGDVVRFRGQSIHGWLWTRGWLGEHETTGWTHETELDAREAMAEHYNKWWQMYQVSGGLSVGKDG